MVSTISNSMEETLHGIINILPQNSFCLHTFSIKNMMPNSTCCVFDSRCFVLIHPSSFHEIISTRNARLQHGTRKCLKFSDVRWDGCGASIKGYICEKKQRAYAETCWYNRNLVQLFEVVQLHLSNPRLWWGSLWRAILASNVQMCLVLKGYPHVLKDFRWVWFLGT